MNKDDDLFGWPNDFDREDDPIILNWQYFKDLFFGMLAILLFILFLFILTICIKSIIIYILTSRTVMLKLLWLLLIPLIFFILNLSKWIRTNRFSTNYQMFWLNRSHMKMKNIKDKKQEIISLLQEANIKPFEITITEPSGYGFASHSPTSSFDNLFYDSDAFVRYNMQALQQAKEVYRQRMFTSINPISWLEILLFLPQNILKYMGLPPKSLASRILNVIYWVMGIVVAIINEPIKNYITKIISDLLGL